jgi:hypothetical protein
LSSASPTVVELRLGPQATGGWKTLQRLSESAFGQFDRIRDVHFVDPARGSDRWHRTAFRFWRTLEAGKEIADTYDRDGKWTGGSARVYNIEYAVILKRTVQDAPYIVTAYGRDPKMIQRVKAEIDADLDALDAVYGLPLAEITLLGAVRAGDYRLVSCEPVKPERQGLVEASISFTNGLFRNKPRFVSADIVMDPSQNWRVLDSTVHDRMYTNTTHVEYDGPDAAIRRVVQRGQPDDRSGTDVVTTEVSSLSFGETPASEFRLASLGLPEIGTPASHRRWNSAIIGGNLVVLALLIYLLYRRRRKRSVANEQPTQ